MNNFALFAQKMMANKRPVKHSHITPNPKGILKTGSCSDVVLRYLQSVSPQFVPRAEIVAALESVQVTCSSVDWALHYLRSQGMIDAYTVSGGSYMLYRVPK